MIGVEDTHRAHRIDQPARTNSDDGVLGPQPKDRRPYRRPEPRENVRLTDKPPHQNRRGAQSAGAEPESPQPSARKGHRKGGENCQQPGARTGEHHTRYQRCTDYEQHTASAGSVHGEQGGNADHQKRGGQVGVLQQPADAQAAAPYNLESNAGGND